MSSRPDFIFELHQLWQSGFSRVYSNCCCSCSFKHEIIKICQSSHKIYSNKILNFQESMTILNACTKKSENLLNAPRILQGFQVIKNNDNKRYREKLLWKLKAKILPCLSVNYRKGKERKDKLLVVNPLVSLREIKELNYWNNLTRISKDG